MEAPEFSPAAEEAEGSAEAGQGSEIGIAAQPPGAVAASARAGGPEFPPGDAAGGADPGPSTIDSSLDRGGFAPTAGSEPLPDRENTALASGPEPGEESASFPPPTATPPEPAPPEPVPPEAAAPQAAPPEPAPVAPALSLLEQAAALRQERLRQLTAPAAAAPVREPEAAAAVPLPAAPLPAAPLSAVPLPRPSAAEAETEPSLGAFDDAFTWSAEVLAAQGRRVEDVSIEEIDWLTRLRRGLEKTRRGFVTQLLETLGDDPLSPEVLDDLETTLLQADVGVRATDLVLEALRRRLNEEVVDPSEGLRFLKEQLRQLLDAPTQRDGRPLLAPSRDRLNVWLLVGVNGVGKTTTLGKLANLASRSGYSCLIAAADTFRAAAVEQVTVWGERSGVPVIANPSPHADPAAVVYDAIGAARSRGCELVLVDTAGRLQTKHNLMEELAKVRRIVDRLAPEAAVESLLVLDASQGQNGLRQAMAFAPAAGLTGVVLTKLDGSARGGVAIAVAHDAGLPIRFVGAGEGVRDLRPFNSFEFVEALLSG
ncbi:MAG: signal recognition particle-docking protein FtsY [Synechococcaceae cyanobacterium]